jgi:hypothetical protein
MSQRRFGIGVLVLAALLAVPRTGSAGIGEVILELSGPKMFGVGLECRLLLSGDWESCKVSTALGKVLGENQPNRKVWLALGGSFYWSLDSDVNAQHYDTGEVKMWSLDPMLEIESWGRGSGDDLRLQVYHGILGVSYNVLHGKNFPTFSNAALRLRPFGIVVPFNKNWGIDFSYNIRLYPNAFEAEDFGKVTVPGFEPGAGTEAVQSFVVGLRFKVR